MWLAVHFFLSDSQVPQASSLSLGAAQYAAGLSVQVWQLLHRIVGRGALQPFVSLNDPPLPLRSEQADLRRTSVVIRVCLTTRNDSRLRSGLLGLLEFPLPGLYKCCQFRIGLGRSGPCFCGERNEEKKDERS